MKPVCHQPIILAVCNHQREDNVVQTPAAVKQHNLHMGGVDQVDQHLHMFTYFSLNMDCIEKLHSDSYLRLY